MAEGIVQEYARRLLATGRDISRDLRGRGKEFVASPEEQRMRFSMQNVEDTRNRGTPPIYRDGEMIAGVSRSYAETPTSKFADQYFNNLPYLLERDAEGYIVPSPNRGVEILELGKDNLGGILDEDMPGTRLELLAGEMLALAQRAAEGKASPEELQLLETYQEFMTSRTGM